MKIARRIFLVLVVLLLLAYARSEWRSYQARKPVEEALAALKRDGFNTDLAELDLELSTQEAKNFQLLEKAGSEAELPHQLQMIDLATPVKADAGYVSLRDITIHGGDYWSTLGEHLQYYTAILDEACQILLSDPVKLLIKTNITIDTPFLSSNLKHLSDVLSRRTLWEIYRGNHTTAWTNLLAVTRLGTRQIPAPFETHRLLQFQSLSTAAKTTWETLQTNVWSENQLALLQQEWESLELWKNLPDTIAYRRIASCEIIRAGRENPPIIRSDSPLAAMKSMLQSPKEGAQRIHFQAEWFLKTVEYRKRGSYQLETTVIENYWQLERAYQKAVTLQNWQLMSHQHAVTNGPYLDPSIFDNFTYPSEAVMQIYAMQFRDEETIASNFEAAAEIETIRRLAVVAIALKRFQIQFQKYPDTLHELTPRFLTTIPLDFMDGQPLRYRKTANDDFVIYSVGHDGIDSGGVANEIWTEFFPTEPPYHYNCKTKGYDIVWLRPASKAEILSLPNSLEDYQNALGGGWRYYKSPLDLMLRYGVIPATPRYLIPATPRYLESITSDKP